MKNYKILVGIFGIESCTSIVVQKLRSKNFIITALWDKNLTKAKQLALENSIPYHSDDYNEIIMRKDVDLVIVFSAAFYSIPIATRAVSIGKHVICNNCAGTNNFEMTRMVEAGLYYPQLMSLPFNHLRFNEAYCSLKEHVEDIGKIYYIRAKIDCQCLGNHSKKDFIYDWPCETNMGGGVLNIYGSNIIDIVCHIISGNIPVRVFGSLQRLDGLHCDSVASFELTLDNDIHVYVTITAFLEGPTKTEFLVSGSQGYLVVRDLNLFRYLYGDQQETLLMTSGQSRIKSIEEEFSCNEFTIGLSNLINSLHNMFIYNEEQKKMTYQSNNKMASFTDMGIVTSVINSIRQADVTKCVQHVDYND